MVETGKDLWKPAVPNFSSCRVHPEKAGQDHAQVTSEDLHGEHSTASLGNLC